MQEWFLLDVLKVDSISSTFGVLGSCIICCISKSISFSDFIKASVNDLVAKLLVLSLILILVFQSKCTLVEFFLGDFGQYILQTSF